METINDKAITKLFVTANADMRDLHIFSVVFPQEEKKTIYGILQRTNLSILPYPNVVLIREQRVFINW